MAKCAVKDCGCDVFDGVVCEDHAAMFEYLDDLRDSGETNMCGAGSYVADEFGLNRNDARVVLFAWMETFGQRHSAS